LDTFPALLLRCLYYTVLLFPATRFAVPDLRIPPASVPRAVAPGIAKNAATALTIELLSLPYDFVQTLRLPRKKKRAARFGVSCCAFIFTASNAVPVPRPRKPKKVVTARVANP
jgi:hypothetical protein